MPDLYKNLLRPILFCRPPEQIHDRTLRLLGWVSRHRILCEGMRWICGAPRLPVRLWGVDFPNPVGLAAGMDKAATALPAWEAMGFGYSEVGAVTARAQPGNPQPRVFRAIAEEAIVNRMGFNNPGAAAVAATLEEWRARGRWPRHPVGINLGKSKATPLEKAAEDYCESLRCLQPWVDFFVINVSSPNTPNLRRLQDKSALGGILEALDRINRPAAKNRSNAGVAPVRKPLLIKVAPELDRPALDDIVDLVDRYGVDGLVATNTTVARPDSVRPDCRRVYAESGGLSGRPLRARSTEVIRYLYGQTGGKIPILGVGGIFTADDAWEKLTAGASLVQVYTGLVYEGPWMVRRIVRGLRGRMQREGFTSLSEVVGCGR